MTETIFTFVAIDSGSRPAYCLLVESVDPLIAEGLLWVQPVWKRVDLLS